MVATKQDHALILYGIKNCDTIKKARRYLENHQVDFQFHDYRTNGLKCEMLQAFIDKVGFSSLINTRGTTWRNLPETQRQAATHAGAAQELMLAHPAIIKRPLLCNAQGEVLLGFSEASYQQFIQQRS